MLGQGFCCETSRPKDKRASQEAKHQPPCNSGLGFRGPEMNAEGRICRYSRVYTPRYPDEAISYND